MLTAGLRWAPEIAPMKRIIARTIRPGSVTSAVRLIAPLLTALTTPPPAPTSTSKNFPRSSEDMRRHSKAGLSKFLRVNSSEARGLRTECSF